MNVKQWFPTLIYHAPLGGGGVARLNRELLAEARKIRAADVAGKKWSASSYPGGYTSYGSLDQLQRMSTTFIGWRERVDRHVRALARSLEWDLRGRQLQMTDCWVNFMARGAAHTQHLHPLAAISGTYYLVTPQGCPGLKFEDPRLSKFMAAPPRRSGASSGQRLHVTYPAKAGTLILFESWLRHEVPASLVNAERVSLSFNYHWT